MAEKIPVNILIKTVSRTQPDEPGDELKLVAQGELTFDGLGVQLRYREIQRDETTGEKTEQNVVMDVTDRRVTMNRTGDFGALMLFEEGHRYEGEYQTPWGAMSMAILPSRVSQTLGRDKGCIELCYTLEMQGAFAAENRLTLEYRAKRSSL